MLALGLISVHNLESDHQFNSRIRVICLIFECGVLCREIVEELAIKDVYMLHLCLDHHLPNPSPNSAAILAVVGDAQAEV
jgi:hypothetical protein